MNSRIRLCCCNNRLSPVFTNNSISESLGFLPEGKFITRRNNFSSKKSSASITSTNTATANIFRTMQTQSATKTIGGGGMVVPTDTTMKQFYRGVQRVSGILESPLQILNETNINLEPQPDSGEKLYLTPYLRNGQILEAQDLARVFGLGELDKILSYSGLLTVNQKYDSNIFFWFFPAVNDAETAPVILWLNGGPGASSMFGLFSGHGPFFVDSNYQLQPRKTSWNLNHSVIYIDSPVGTGFSFTGQEEGYATNLNNVVDDLYEGLKQFFTLFPQFTLNDFFVAGQSYAGKYAPAISHKIHTENKNNPDIPINLKGLAIGSGLCDPLTQVDYGEYLYNIGLIDELEKSHFDNSYKEVCKLINNENWADAHRILQHLVIGWPRPIVSHFETVTGYSFNSNYLQEEMPERYAYYMRYLEFPDVRRSIHVGDIEFGKMRNKVYNLLAHDFAKSVKPLVEELLDSKIYKILFYASQLDVIVPHTSVDKFVRSLNWVGKEEYSQVNRNIWRVDNDVAGYSKEVKTLIHLLIRNAGHVAPHDQPEWCFDMITKFTRGESFNEVHK